jgi:V/A-type H+-transporting ATPase subunit K
MIKLVVAIIVGLVPMAPALFYFLRQRGHSPVQATQSLVAGFKAFNLVLALMVAGLGITWLASPNIALAAGMSAGTTSDPYASLAAAIAVGMATLGAGWAVSTTASAAVGAIAEKPESFGRALIFVGLAEGIAIYGLIIAFLLLNR